MRRSKKARAPFPELGVWGEPSGRAQVTREEVVRQALRLLDDEGFDGLTMRRLGERLGIKAASLYNHVKSKQELLALMGDAISAEIPDLDRTKPWRTRLERSAVELRRILLARRDAARVLAATFPAGPQRLRLIEQVLATLREAKFPRAGAADAAYIMNSYVVGFVLDETSAGPADATSAKHMRDTARAWFKSLPADQYPTIVALADELVDAPAERRFALGLRVLLDGFATRFTRARP